MKQIRFYLGLGVLSAFLPVSCGSGSSSSTTETLEAWFGPDTTRLDLIFSLTYDETSKDSNSHSDEIVIKDGKLTYKQTFSGFIAQPEEVKTAKINNQTEKEIFEYLKKMKLTDNITEKKNTRGIGIATYMTLEIFQPEASRIQIQGKTSNWGMDEQSSDNKTDTLSLSKEAREYLDNGTGFVSFINNLISESEK